MSISSKSKFKVLSTFDKWKVWRIINSSTIIIAFFLPWLVMLRDITTHQEVTYTGFRLLQWYQGLTKFEVLIQERELLERLRILIVSLPYFLGLYSILIYCALNSFAVTPTTKFVEKPNWNKLIFGLLVTGVINLLYLVKPWRYNWVSLDYLSLLKVGYWLVWFGLVSSTLLEISYSLKKGSNI